MRVAIINDGLLTVVVLTLAPSRPDNANTAPFVPKRGGGSTSGTKGMPIGPARPSHTGWRRFRSHTCEPFRAAPTPREFTAAKGRLFAGNGTETWNSSAAADQSVTHYIVMSLKIRKVVAKTPDAISGLEVGERVPVGFKCPRLGAEDVCRELRRTG